VFSCCSFSAGTIYYIEVGRARDKPRDGVVANTPKLYRNGAVGFVDWLGPPTVADDEELEAVMARATNTMHDLMPVCLG
jgi:hypothetical protein